MAAIIGSLAEVGFSFAPQAAAVGQQSLLRGALYFGKNVTVDHMVQSLNGGLIMEMISASLIGGAASFLYSLEALKAPLGLSAAPSAVQAATGSVVTAAVRMFWM